MCRSCRDTGDGSRALAEDTVALVRSSLAESTTSPSHLLERLSRAHTAMPGSAAAVLISDPDESVRRALCWSRDSQLLRQLASDSSLAVREGWLRARARHRTYSTGSRATAMLPWSQPCSGTQAHFSNRSDTSSPGAITLAAHGCPEGRTSPSVVCRQLVQFTGEWRSHSGHG